MGPLHIACGKPGNSAGLEQPAHISNPLVPCSFMVSAEAPPTLTYVAHDMHDKDYLCTEHVSIQLSWGLITATLAPATVMEHT